MDNQNCYVTDKEVSKITCRALPTLRNDRFLRRGIPYTKYGRSVRYNLQDVYDYMKARKIQTEEVPA